MKIFLTGLFGFLVSGHLLVAQTTDQDRQRMLDAAVLGNVMISDNIKPDSTLGDLINNIQAMIEESKEGLFLYVTDTNGNGQIDAGAEWDSFLKLTREWALDPYDSNKDGKIDVDEFNSIARDVWRTALGKDRDKLCPKYLEEAEGLTEMPDYFPSLKELQAVCYAD